MKQILESMTRIVLSKYLVRIWRDESVDYEHKPDANEDLRSIAKANEGLPPAALAKKIAELSRVTAVEVITKDESRRDGVVYYPDWS